jgi:plastocyanin
LHPRRTMSRIRFALLGGVVASLVLAATASAAPVKLSAVVGPGFNISLKKGSTKVTKLKAGKYTISVSDKSNIHNFHLTGPGVNKKTGVGFKGTATWTVTLKNGLYKFLCDPHKAIMKGSFRVS